MFYKFHAAEGRSVAAAIRAGPGVAVRQRRRRPADRARARFATALSVTAFFATRRAVRRAARTVRRVGWVRPLVRAAALLRLAARGAALLLFARLSFVLARLELSRDLPAARGTAFAAVGDAAAPPLAAPRSCSRIA